MLAFWDTPPTPAHQNAVHTQGGQLSSDLTNLGPGMPFPAILPGAGGLQKSASSGKSSQKSFSGMHSPMCGLDHGDCHVHSKTMKHRAGLMEHADAAERMTPKRRKASSPHASSEKQAWGHAAADAGADGQVSLASDTHEQDITNGAASTSLSMRCKGIEAQSSQGWVCMFALRCGLAWMPHEGELTELAQSAAEPTVISPIWCSVGSGENCIKGIDKDMKMDQQASQPGETSSELATRAASVPLPRLNYFLRHNREIELQYLKSYGV